MKIALDPYMLRDRPFAEVCRIAADIGYDSIELSPRPDFIPFFSHPRADRAKVAEFRSALQDTGIELASILPLYRWSSPDEDERLAAVRYWKRAIQLAVDVGCSTMNSEFNGRPEQAAPERGAILAFARGAPADLRARGRPVESRSPPRRLHRDRTPQRSTWSVGSIRLSSATCSAHRTRIYLGDDVGAMIEYSAPVLAQVHVADVLNHRASSGNRYIVNPPGSPARVHQHLDIGQGEVDFEACFSALRRIGFDGILTSCVFAWEERAVESSRFMFERIRSYLDNEPATA